MKSVYETYLKEVGKLLPSSGPQRKDYLQRLTISVMDYASEHANCTLEDLERAFGAPDEIANSYLDGTDPKQISAKLSTRKRLWICILSIIATATVILCLFKFIQYKMAVDLIEGYTYEVIDELPSEVDPTPTIYKSY